MPSQTVRVKAADSLEPSDSSDANLREDIGHHDLLGITRGQLVLHHSVLAEFLTTKIQFYPKQDLKRIIFVTLLYVI